MDKDAKQLSNKNGLGAYWPLWLACFVGMLVTLSRLMTGAVSLWAGIVLTVLGLLMFLRPGDWKAIRNYLAPGDLNTCCLNWFGIALLTVVLLVLAAIAIPNCGPPIKDAARNAELSHNLHSVVLHVERYAADHSPDACNPEYPERLDVLFNEGYLDSFPGNPLVSYRDKPEEMDWRQISDMQMIGADNYPVEYRDHLRLYGNFCYLPIYGEKDDDEKAVVDYLVLGFGRTRWYPGWNSWARKVPVVLTPH